MNRTAETSLKIRINYFYMQHHRYLREVFKMETIERHQDKIATALRSRFASQARIQPKSWQS